ncbi:unnamed protein product [Bursaphelenchus xylophilus]|uniref:(pine wood nematode) hypothetical protein n=1 Tax=Bursaphelenchus xylophilus TaxID=6326 RepID=A0A1I7SX73_BURXY|nr:unnamed protein product [Bursaphelenchus xylophilus]CAG9100228.1 unnamed protein product [Bursaphelenchus xylophilus]
MTAQTRVAKRFMRELPYELIDNVIQRLPVLDVLFVYSCTLDCRVLDSYEETFARICVENYNPLRESRPSLSFLWHLLTVSLHHRDISDNKDLHNELMNLRSVSDLPSYQKLKVRMKVNLPGVTHHVPIKVDSVIASSERETEVELSYGAQKFEYGRLRTVYFEKYSVACFDGPFLYMYGLDVIVRINLLEDDRPRCMGFVPRRSRKVRMAVSRSNAFVFSENRRGNCYLHYLSMETKETCGTKAPAFDVSTLSMTAIDKDLFILSNDMVIRYSVEGGRLVTDDLKWLGLKSYPTMVDKHGYLWFHQEDGANFRYTSIVNGRSFDVECDEPRQRPIVLSKNFFRIGSTSFYVDENGVVNIKKWMLGKTRVFDLLSSYP